MAFKLFIICALAVAFAEANFFFPQLPEFKMPPMPTMPPFPKLTFHPITMPPMPKLLSVQEIIEQSKKLGGTSNHQVAAVSSHSQTVVGEDGKPITTGGTSMYSDNNGKVHKFVFDDSDDKSKDSSTKTPKDPKKETTKDKPKKEKTKEEPKVTEPEVPVFNPFDIVNGHTISNFAVSGNNGGGGGGSVAFSSSNGGGGGFQSSFASSTGGLASSFSTSSSSSSSSSSNTNGVKSSTGAASSSYNVNGESGGDTFAYTI